MNKHSYFITKVSMFGLGYRLLINECERYAYIPIILGSIIGIIFIYILSKVKTNKVLITILCIYLSISLLVLLSTFVSSFY